MPGRTLQRIILFAGVTMNLACRQQRACRISIDNNYIGSGCTLANGVRFDELAVSRLGKDRLPLDFTVLNSFNCYPTGTGTPETAYPERIYLDRDNGPFRWTSGCYQEGRYEPQSPPQEIAPFRFHRDTWYAIDFYDRRYKAFLYIDRQNRFHLSRVDL